MAGVRVPLERRFMGTTMLPWKALIEASAADLSLRQHTRAVGALLSQPLAHLGVPFVTGAQTRLVMLDVPDELAAIPWEWTHVNGKPLCMHAPVCRTVPDFDDASRGRPFFHKPLRVLLIGDAISESPRYPKPLPGTRDEVNQIRRLFLAESKQNHVTLLVGRAASYERVLHEMTERYDIVHLAGVAYVEEESVIPLHDGHVLASELATLLIRHPPGLLFVNEDFSGFVPSIVEESDLTAFPDFYYRMQKRRPGLERVVARAGVGTFIGCMSPSTESAARDIAVRFYSHLLAGCPVAEALFRARAVGPMNDSFDTPLLFAMAGYPDAVVTRNERKPRRRQPRR
jgi:hypothetical protein